MIVRDLIKKLSEKDDTLPVMVYIDGEPVEIADVDNCISDRVDLVIGEYVIDNRVEELEERVKRLEERLADADKTIRYYCQEGALIQTKEGDYVMPVCANMYLKKWGIK